MGYQANRQVCAVVTDCENNDSVDTAICVPDASGENVESLNSKEAINENVEETTGISEESETRSVSDSASKREESINSNIYDDVISTPESIIDNPLSVDNYEDNNDDLYKVSLSPTPPIQDISTSDGIDETSNQALSSTESAREIQNEKDDSVLDLRITSPPTVEFRDNAYIMTPMTSTPVYNTDINSNVDPETADTPFSTVNYKSLKLDDRTQDITTESYNDDETATLPNSNIETLDSYLPTSTPFSSINDKSLNVDEETRDVTRAIDSYQTSTISNVPESSTIIDIPSKLYEEMQDTTEEYRNNYDKTMALLNSNTGAIDSTSTISSILEFPPTSETSKLYEEMQSATTEQYNNDDRIVTPSNSNIEVIDPILSDISATTNNPSDFDTSTLSSAILPQADINDDQYTKELFKTSPSVDSKLVDPNLDVPEAIESVPTGYSSEHIDTLNLASTTTSPPQMDIIPTIKDLPAISDTDLITQNGKDSTEASPFIEQDPITNN